MDVKSAYLNAPIDQEIYVQQPKGFVVKDVKGDECVWRLKKSLYGLKQSGRNWNECVHNTFVDLGFVRSDADPCLYVKQVEQCKIMAIIWVDDILLASNSSLFISQC